jgi:hypothetical protein
LALIVRLQRRAAPCARREGPIVAELEPWLREKLELIRQKAKLAEAIRYALSRWQASPASCMIVASRWLSRRRAHRYCQHPSQQARSTISGPDLHTASRIQSRSLRTLLTLRISTMDFGGGVHEAIPHTCCPPSNEAIVADGA